MTASPTAPAAVPSEEDIKKLVHQAMLADPEEGRFRHRVSERSLIASDAARAILALFAPILAEKERARQMWQKQATTFAEVGESWQTRALAAEAALAGERERCLAIVEAQVPDWVKERSGPYWDGYREAMEDAANDIRKGAAAIRAEGE